MSDVVMMSGRKHVNVVDGQWDRKSCSNLHFLSFVLFSFLPVQQLKRRYDHLSGTSNEKIRFHRYVYRHSNVTVLGAGSCAEGITCPNISHPKDTESFSRTSRLSYEELEEAHNKNTDLDIMIARPCSFSDEGTMPDYCIDVTANDVHPGYVRLVKTMDGNHADGMTYVKNIVNHSSTKESNANTHCYDSHGPAQRGTLQKKIDNTPFHQFLERVFCLSHPGWPDHASEWLRRHRPSGWPSPTLIHMIRLGGFHFVPVAHPNSKQPDVEWRFSFSQAEVALVQSLTWTHRQCFVLTKMLCKHVLRDCDVWCSYYLKTVLLWYCENKPASCWKPINLASCFFGLLDLLLEFLKDQNIPNYFIRSQNMTSHVHPKTFTHLVDRIDDLRSNPLKHILEWKATYFCAYSNIMVPFGTLYKDFIEATRKEENKNFQVNLLNVAAFYLQQGRPLEARDVLEHEALFIEDVTPASDMCFSLFKCLLENDALNAYATISNLQILLLSQKGIPANECIYDDIHSKVNQLIEFTLSKTVENTSCDLKTSLLVGKSLNLYMAGKHDDAYRFSKHILQELQSRERRQDSELIIPLDTVLLYECQFILDKYETSFNGMLYHSSTSPAHALYIMIKAGKKAKLFYDEDHVQPAFQYVLSSCSFQETVLNNAMLLAYSYIEINKYMYAVFYLVIKPGNERYVVSIRLVNILICLMLELLHIAISRKWVTSHKLQLLAKVLLELLMTPQKSNTSDTHNIGNVLWELAQVYEKEMMTIATRGRLCTVDYFESQEKCYLAYRASLQYDGYLNTEVLSGFIGFLWRTSHCHMDCISVLYDRLLMLQRFPIDSRIIDTIPALPFLEQVREHSKLNCFDILRIMQTGITYQYSVTQN